ncbi:ER membrane protein complex subunit 10-like [Branchiostoma floridae]|uniref:ER membrane protein complex subunit 10 n=1 Tax=Branchiostoma floridae TaxID=7739 RepID=A0A9J7L3I8_BRAFL|nr:ER membrane protein complex subunit 10-like [Branchiostoma floridae]
MATTMESFSRFCLWFLVFLPVICFCQVLSDMDLPAGAAPQPNIPTLSVTVEHSFDQGRDQTFTARGTISWKTMRSTSGTYVQGVPLSEQDRDRLKVLADAGGFYRIRVPNKFGLIGDSTTDYVSTLVRADLLYNSCLSDIITLNIDMLGHIIGVAMATVPEGCEGDEVETFDLSLFNTTVEIAQPVTGPVPETQAYIQKIEQERAEKEKGQPPEQRSFFAKYWMYILPIVLFLILSPGQPEGGQGGGGQGGGGRGGNGGG